MQSTKMLHTMYAAPDFAKEYEDSIGFEDALALLCQMSFSMFVLFDAINRCISNHRERIRNMEENTRKKPVLVWSQSKHVEKVLDFESGYIPLMSIAIELTYVIIVPFLILYYSKRLYREFVIFYQGGIIAYGSREKRLSLQNDSGIGGLEFSVAH